MCINISNIINLKQRLKAFADEGVNLAREVGQGVVPTPSRISTMLRDNFKERAFNVSDEVRHAEYGNGIVDTIIEQHKQQIAFVDFGNGRRAKVAISTLRHR